MTHDRPSTAPGADGAAWRFIVREGMQQGRFGSCGIHAVGLSWAGFTYYRLPGTSTLDTMPDGSFNVVGRRLGQYTIQSLLGRGGMGEVYRARDEQLGRDVAVKVLRNVRLLDPTQRTRFDQEARVLAALNHPHIATIYGIDDSAGMRALVLELVEGPTIADLVASGPLPIKDALLFSRQIAEALEAAHEKGIIHRDLKPANIKVTPDRRAKVLDFGLAKAIQTDGSSPLDMCETIEGAIVGTAAYMSPEQARGLAVDKRSDIWSFGCVVYEMLTGQRAFAGAGLSDVMLSLLEREPDWSALPAKTPMNVRHLVQRCLQKDPRERLRDIGEARIELQEALNAPGSSSSSLAVTPRPRRWSVTGRGAAVVILAAAVAAAAYWGTRQPDVAALVGRPRQLTAGAGWQVDPALSPDGSFIAYSSNESGPSDIWIVDAQGGNPLRLTPGDGTYSQPAWFPDGSALAFVSRQREHSSIWRVARLGGTPSLLIDDGFNPAISPDGSTIAFARKAPSGFTHIALAPIADGSRARLITTDADGLWNHRQPAWSPDGRKICYVAQNALWMFDVEDGRAWPLTTDHEYDREPVWSADGRYVYFSSFREGTEALWRVPSGGGRPERVTMGTGPERQPSVSRDGARLAYSTLSSTSDVALIDLQSGKEVELSGVKNEFRPSLAPDGSAVAFASDRWGDRLDLWVQPLVNFVPEGSPIRLTDSPGFSNYPSYSPDGRWLAYSRVDGDRREIWMVPARGGPPVRITDGPGAKFHPGWSPDGSRVAFAAQSEGTYQIGYVPVNAGRPTGPPVTVIAGTTLYMSPAWSPDGSEIAYVGSSGQIWIVATTGERTARRLGAANAAERVRWNRRSGRLFSTGFWDGEQVSVREVDLRTGSLLPLPFPVVLGASDEYVDFDVSLDERLLAFDREKSRGAVWMVDSKSRP